eukprot:gene11005-12826_t
MTNAIATLCDLKYTAYVSLIFTIGRAVYILGAGPQDRIPKIICINLDSLVYDTYMDGGIVADYNQQDDNLISCFDHRQGYLYIINIGESEFIRLSLATKEIKKLAPHPRSTIKKQYQIVLIQHLKRIYSVCDRDARYYDIASDKWYNITKPPVKLTKCGVVCV